MEATQVIHAIQVARTMQKKKHGRLVSSKDKQPHKKRAKKANLEEEDEQNRV